MPRSRRCFPAAPSGSTGGCPTRLPPPPNPPAPTAAPRAAKPRRAIAFPGPSIARKGAHALREAALALDLEILVVGQDLEGGDFWQGLDVRSVARDPPW